MGQPSVKLYDQPLRDSELSFQRSISLADISSDFDCDLAKAEYILDTFIPKKEVIKTHSDNGTNLVSLSIEAYIRFLLQYGVFPEDKANLGKSTTTTGTLEGLGIDNIFTVDLDNLIKVVK